MTLILSNEEVARVLTMESCVNVLEDAYKEQAEGRAINQLRYDTEVPVERNGLPCNYQFKTMVGIIPKFGVCALRMSSTFEFWQEVHGLTRVDRIPISTGNRLVGLVQLFSLENGDLLAVYPDGYVQGMRVGGTYALATKYLARKDSKVLGLYGSGHQARFALMAHKLVSKLRLVKVYSPNLDHRTSFAAEMSRELDLNIEAVHDPREVMRSSDIVLAMTNSVDPVLKAGWLEEGMHVTSVKGEVDSETLKRADLIALNSRLRYETRIAGVGQYGSLVVQKNTRHRLPLDREQYPLLEDIIAGKVPGRTSEKQITYFDSGSGLGIQFAATAYVIYRLAKEGGLGREVPNEWFTQTLHT